MLDSETLGQTLDKSGQPYFGVIGGWSRFSVDGCPLLSIVDETLEKLQNASIEERITIIEVLLRSLKNDIKKNDFPQSDSTGRPQRPAFGFMKDKGKILGDVVAPVLSENTWEVLQYFSPGQGDYTRKRHEWLDRTSLEEIVRSMRQRREDGETQYDEIIE